MPYQPTNPFPYNIAIDLQEGLQFRFKVDNYDVIESFQIDLYDLLKKEKIYTIVRTTGDIKTQQDNTGKEIKTLIEGDKQIIQIFDDNEEQILLEEYDQGDSILPLKGGFGEYGVGEVNLTNYIVALEDIKKQQNYGDTPNFQSLTITSENCFDIDKETGTITEYIEENNLESKENIVIPYEVDGTAVKNIGEGVFANNKNIVTVVIPACVSSIGSNSFSGCTNLNSVFLNYGNSIIGSHCFEGCVLLSDINLLDSITIIEDYAFYGCTSLLNLRLPWGLKTIGAYSFSGIGIESLQLSKEVVSIEEEAFSNCNALGNVNCNEKLQKIGVRAFAGCTSLSEITFNNNIQTIEEEAFLNNAFVDFEVPNSVIELGVGFLKGNKIETLTVPFIGQQNGDNEAETSVLGHFFGQSSESGIIQQYAENSSKFYAVPDTLKTVVITQATFVPYGAFYNCENIQQVQMNQEVTRIEDYAFYNCKNFLEIEFPPNITYIGNYAFALAEPLIS